MAKHASNVHSADELLQAVCETVVNEAGLSGVTIALVTGAQGHVRVAAACAAGERAVAGSAHWYIDAPTLARLRAGEVVEVEAEAARRLLPPSPATPAQGVLAAPIVCRGSLDGVMLFGTAGRPLPELTELVQAVARQTAVGLVSVTASAQQQEDAEVSGILLGISQALTTCLDEQELWRRLAQGTREMLGVGWSLGLRWDEERAAFTVKAASGIPEPVATELAGAQFNLESTPLLEDILSRRELFIGNDSLVRSWAAANGWSVGSWLVVPLVRGASVLGFLALGYFRRRTPFTRRQRRLAEGIGEQASISLQNARLVADLEHANQLKSEFVSTASHELRTPLHMILGYIEMLREGAAGPLTSDQHALVARLDVRSRELSDLIEATLHAGRLEAGREVIEMARVTLVDLIRGLQAGTTGLPRATGVGFEWDLPADLSGAIVTDRAKVTLVVRNLVSNALKFTPAGKVTVRVRPEGPALVIEVSDTGIGIAPEHLPVIFDMFRQVNGGAAIRQSGIGLGLYIVKQFVDRLGGKVEVHSQPQRGSTFRVRLPGYASDAQEVRASVA